MTVGLVLLLGVSVGAALLGTGVGCEREQDSDVITVTLDGRAFHLELAADNDVRFQGLSGREHIEADGGMLFVFPRPQVLQFVMRDCLVPIDIIFVDAAGRIVAMHAMTVEDPKGATETQAAYEARLRKYSSRFAAQFAIELAGGTLETLDLEEGEQIALDWDALKRRAR